MISVKSINKSIYKSELLIIWPLFCHAIIIKVKSGQMISNSDLHMLLLIDFTDIMMTRVQPILIAIF